MKEKKQPQKHFKDPGTGTHQHFLLSQLYSWPGAVALVSSGGPQPPPVSTARPPTKETKRERV